jgi:hypothetical protein
MFRFTVTASNPVNSSVGYQSNAILAYKASVELAASLPGGAIITVDDLESGNTLFHTESVIGK